MKPKTFTYNQIIQFFNDNRMPLKVEQVNLIASKVKEELVKLEEYRARQKDKRDREFLKKEKKRKERLTAREKKLGNTE